MTTYRQVSGNISCRAPSHQSRHAFARLLYSLVQLPRRLQCPEPVAVDTFCYDRATHSELRLTEWSCADDGCSAVFDCHPLLGERASESFGLTLAVIVVLIVVVLIAERRATAARLEALRNKLR